MGNQVIAIWISAGALLVSTLVLVSGYLKKRPFVPASLAEELRGEIGDLRSKVAAQTVEIAGLKNQLGIVMSDREWWREAYQKLKAERGQP
jgi:hypothetical protein